MKKIRSIIGYTSFVGEDGISENEYKSSYQEYDHNQNVIKDIIYTEDGEFETASEYKFNEANVLLEEIHYLNETDVAERLAYIYDDNENLNEIEITYSDGSKSIKKTSKNGQVLSVTIVDENNNLEGTEIRKIDANGNVVEEIIYDENKNIQQKFLHIYDSEYQIISTTEFGVNEGFIIKKVFEYDGQKHIIKETHYSERGKQINVIISEYNEQGELCSQQYDNNYAIKISYDEEGRRVRDETINLSNELTESLKVYKYDENNFLIEKISYEMGQQYELEPRVLARASSNYISTRLHYEFY